jgi:GlcNAc-P-P-Und epimerase
VGHECVILDLIKPDWPVGDADFIHGDIRDESAAERAMRGCDRVLHLAAAHHDFGIAESTFFSVNQYGSRILCKVADRLGIREICFYSTIAVYGEIPEPRDEQAIPKPISPYGRSKLAGEGVFREWTQRGEARHCLVIRPTVTYGPRNFANMYTLIKQIHRGRFFPVGDGKNIKSLSYVENIVEATMYVWDREPAAPHDVYNYIDKPDLSAREIAEQVYASLGKRAPRVHIPQGLACAAAIPFDLAIALTGRNLPISSTRIRKLCTQTRCESDRILATGFKPRIDLREGIDRMVRWYLQQGQHQKAIWNLPPSEAVFAGAAPKLA